MKISIALATFNGGKFLQEQLDSFVNQTRIPDEIIISDDGSIDDTINIIKDFSQDVPSHVILLQNETPIGFTKNFEKALCNCSGDLIFFSDQDDVWLPTKIARIESYFFGNPDAWLVIHDGKLVDENLDFYGMTKLQQVIKGYGKSDGFATGCLTAIKRELLPVVLPFSEHVKGHDRWLHAVAELIKKRHVLDDVYQLIRRHSNNTSSFVASSVNSINKIDVFKSQFSTIPANSYQDRISLNSELQDKLAMFINFRPNDLSPDYIQQQQNKLSYEKEVLSRREALLKLSLPRQKLFALKMLLNGDYQYFNGINSFFRDMLRGFTQ